MVEEYMLMDDQQQQRLNEAADQFTTALVESFRTVAARGEAAQEQGAQLSQDFFSRVINNLHTQAEDTRQMTQQLADQQQRVQEAGQALTQESIGAYMDFVNSMFSFWQGSVEVAERGTTEAQRRTATAATPPAPERGATGEAQGPSTTTTTTEAPPEEQAAAELPLEDYDLLTVEQISQRLDDLSAEALRQLRAYEAENKSRSTLLQRLDERIEAS
jgi:hypothetical protein